MFLCLLTKAFKNTKKKQLLLTRTIIHPNQAAHSTLGKTHRGKRANIIKQRSVSHRLMP